MYQLKYIRWIAIYPMDRVIRSLNSRGLAYIGFSALCIFQLINDGHPTSLAS